MKDLEGFRFSKELQLRWNDMDALGHANNAIFITYFETGRAYYMLEAVPSWDWHKNMFLIANVNVNFQKELLLMAQNPAVWMRTTKIGSKSFTLEYVITSEKNGEYVYHASGTTTQIMFDMKQRKTLVIESWIKKGLTEYETITIEE